MNCNCIIDCIEISNTKKETKPCFKATALSLHACGYSEFLLPCPCRMHQAAKDAKGGGKGPKGDKALKPTRIRTSDITDSDYSVFQNSNKFPQSRRIRVVAIESEEGASSALGAFKEGGAFILRPKRGKSLIKLMKASW